MNPLIDAQALETVKHIRQALGSVPALTQLVWDMKYRYKLPDGTSNEDSPSATNERVVKGVFAKDPRAEEFIPTAIWMHENLLWCPGGRVMAGVGTPKRVTAINCFVSPIIEDSMPSIMQGLEVAALTQQMGGGIGMDFSTLRPNGAIVKGVGSISSGPLSFMRMWHWMCSTIMSSGSRRGAMMATLSDSHPDIYRPFIHTEAGKQHVAKLLDEGYSVESIPMDFITCKHLPGQLTNFNISVLVSEKFMQALDKQEMWDLGFGVEPANAADLVDKYKTQGKMFYVYCRVPAQEIWDKILRSTYDYAEPGVIFIDKINEMNNLWYCEELHCTNPCGEQPLPPNGDCNLGALNYAMLVRKPFTKHAEIDFNLLRVAAAVGQRYLDNVLDVAIFPTVDQQAESIAKRRTGQGFMGLGTMLQMMGVRYGTPKAVEITREVVRAHRDAVYQASIQLAQERGTFPLYDAEKFQKGKFVKRLPKELRDQLEEHGIRNGVTMTVAPTGTTAPYLWNTSTGVESDYDLDHTRFVKQADGTKKPVRVETFGWTLYKNLNMLDPLLTPGDVTLPDYMVTALQLSVDEHLVMQAAAQDYIDASISKTINIPEDMPFEEFKNVYRKAYELGLKGCTTYRPSKVRGSVLVSNTKKEEPKKEDLPRVKERPAALHGVTYKAPDGRGGSMFITVNQDPITKHVFEVFLRDNSGNEYVENAGRNLSLLLRADVPVKDIRQQLKRSGGPLSIWYEGKNFSSQLQLLDYVVFEQAAKYFLTFDANLADVESLITVPQGVAGSEIGLPCPDCGAALVSQDSCLKCSECLYSKC